MPYEWRMEQGATELTPGAVMLCGFPSAGLAATVAAHYMIRTLDLPRIGILHSEEELPIAIVQNGRVNPPIRVHGRGQVAIVLSEFPPPPGALVNLAETLLSGAESRKVRILLALEGVVPHPTEDGAPPAEEPAPVEQSWVVTARPDPELIAMFAKASARPLTDAVLGGMTGALLVGAQSR
ncbi:MAG: PAC2 family protein, partial [Thermoplasmata archaeon]|nr:PAC2 family protein [Thermoplasmata archaeon]